MSSTTAITKAGAVPASRGASSLGSAGGAASPGAATGPGPLPFIDVRRPPAVGAETLLGIATVAIVGVMLLPLPPFLLDLLLALSVSVSLVVFLFALHIERPLEFSAFPSVLLLITLFRLALNVASTRLILLRGHEGEAAAGHVIEAFGQFVVGGNTAVGIVVFLILVVINFVVITKGAGRIAEVAARFTLDAMPGKQMAIDADLAAGLINEHEARTRRRAVEQEADFFGSMDGASKFVRGDAIAGLLITAINIVGGFAIGVLQRGLPAAEAASTYTMLTVGDGLSAQIPALLASIAAGFVTTRASTAGALSGAVGKQLFGAKQPLTLAAGVLAALAIVPGMPHVAFLVLAGALGLAARSAGQARATGGAGAGPSQGANGMTTVAPVETERAELEAALPVDLLELEVGFELVALVDTARDGALLRRIGGVRKQLAQELGIIVPPIHMRDNMRLGAGEYRLLLSGNEIGRGEVRVGRVLAMAPAGGPIHLPGESVTEPAFGLPAKWMPANERSRAELNGYTAVDAATVAATHLGELMTAHAHELVGRREVQELLDLHGRENGKLIEELLPNQLSMAQLVRVLRNLLRERVSIRDFRSVLEALADHAAETKDPELLTELVRQRLAKHLTTKHRAKTGAVHALVLAPQVEQLFRRMQSPNAAQAIDPTELQGAVKLFEAAVRAAERSEELPVILTTADVRRSVSTFVQRHLPGLAVLSFRELDGKATLKTIGVIGENRGAVAGAA